MRIMRRVILSGDKLSNGGYIKTASSNTIINDRPLATVGDIGFCPVCNMDAPIVPLNPSNVLYSNEKQNALEGDYLDCHCDQKPVCKAAEDTHFSVEDNIIPPDYNPGLHGHIPRQHATASVHTFNEHFKILNKKTGEPIPHSKYAFQRPDGSREYGLTKGDGSTHVLAATIGTEYIKVYFEGSDES